MDPDKDAIIVDIDASPAFLRWNQDIAPCLTRKRGSMGMWVSCLDRRLCVSEMLRLQGLSPDLVQWEKAKVSRSKMGGACGNAMSCNVLERLLPRVAWAAGLISELPFDNWEREGYFMKA